MALLDVRNIYKVYGKGDNRVEALSNVDLTVEKGEFVAIMGPSGSGKSTLLHAISGVDKPTSGEVYIDGENIWDKNPDELAIFRRRDVGLVYQQSNLISVLNVMENVTLPILLDNRKFNEERLDNILKHLHLEDRKYFLPSQLSGGQRQRTAIGRALINSPAIIFADEPTGNLDSVNSQEVIEIFKNSNKKLNQTIVIITHDEEIALQADRIVFIDDGKIVRDEVAF